MPVNGSGGGGARGSGTPGPSSASVGLELFGSVTALQSRSEHAKALDVLRRAAAQVKPVMKRRGWRVKKLEEFYPNNPSLLGLNHNRGAKIQVRVRSPADPASFLPFDHVLGTLLHELTHIKHAPHDVAFYKLLDEITTETEELIAKGYAGEGFYSHGTRLGSVNVPTTQVRGAAAAAAEKRLKLAAIMTRPGGQRLGGSVDRETLRRYTPAQMAAMAAQRRANDALWCGNLEDGGEVKVEQDNRGRMVTFVPDDDEESAAEAATADGTEKAEFAEAPPAAPSSVVGSPKRRKVSRVADAVESPFWICGTCSLRNQDYEFLCEACSTTRPDRAPDDSANVNREDGASPAKVPPLREPAKRNERASFVSGSVPMWTCPVCTFAGNPESAPACDMCGIARAPDPSEEAQNLRATGPNGQETGGGTNGVTASATDVQWTCPACTFAGNTASARSCEMCGTPRIPPPGGPVTTAAPTNRYPDGGILEYHTSKGDSLWVCPVCTTETSTDYRACRGCVFVRRI